MNEKAGGRPSFPGNPAPGAMPGTLMEFSHNGCQRQPMLFGYSSSMDSIFADMMVLAGTGSCRLIRRVSPQVAVST